MKVDLIDYTGKGFDDPWYAAALMIWTKQTRTQMSPGGFNEIWGWPKHKMIDELNYMAATVPSSWEFCNFTFLISGVTRAFTHQLVRTRTASYAQQAMQVLNMSEGPGWEYLVGPSLERPEHPELKRLYEETMKVVATSYKELVNIPGVKTEDARGLLPTNILTNIVMSANLRSLCDLIRKRVSPRNQGEFVDVLRLMKAQMVQALPWITIFLDREADVVAKELYALLEVLPPGKHKTDLIKRVDQLLTNVGAGEAG